MKSFFMLLALAVHTPLYAFSGSEGQLPGTYDLNVKINGQNYHDVLVIDDVKRTQRGYATSTFTVKGNFEVPNVFSSRLHGSLTIDHPYRELGNLVLGFVADENGQQYDVVLRALIPYLHVNRFEEFEGTLETKQNSVIFGRFIAKKRGSHDE